MKDKTTIDSKVAALADAITDSDNKDTVGKVTEVLEAITSRQHHEVEIIAAVPFTEEQLASLTRALGKRIAPDARITATVDPNLIGGFRVHVGNWLLDASVVHELDLMKKTLLE